MDPAEMWGWALFSVHPSSPADISQKEREEEEEVKSAIDCDWWMAIFHRENIIQYLLVSGSREAIMSVRWSWN